MPPATADAVVDTNEQSRIDGLRVAVSILALISLLALVFTRGIPTAPNPRLGAESSSGACERAGERLVPVPFAEGRRA